jgi:hypothetical protein
LVDGQGLKPDRRNPDMTIEARETLLHWNYFLALEEDLERAARYIEFSESNFKAYSIELAHSLLASASEVDVIAKRICRHLQPEARAENINHYRRIITAAIPSLPMELVFVPRFGLTLHPWSNWADGEGNPLWWRKYNVVKHQRDDHFSDANLKNALNSMAGLLVAVFHFYRLEHGLDHTRDGFRDTTRLLAPESRLLRLSDDYYYGHLLIN